MLQAGAVEGRVEEREGGIGGRPAVDDRRLEPAPDLAGGHLGHAESPSLEVGDHARKAVAPEVGGEGGGDHGDLLRVPVPGHGDVVVRGRVADSSPAGQSRAARSRSARAPGCGPRLRRARGCGRGSRASARSRAGGRPCPCGAGGTARARVRRSGAPPGGRALRPSSRAWARGPSRESSARRTRTGGRAGARRRRRSRRGGSGHRPGHGAGPRGRSAG